jgi:GT2 family glycosyltransferase
MEKIKVIALATFHNRKDKTIRALHSLHLQKKINNVELEFCLVDDGSTDNTSDEIRKNFTDIKLLNGDGSLYWARGMLFGWNNYVKQQEYDYLLVFNDDIIAFPIALHSLIKSAAELKNQSIDCFAISGGLKDPNTNDVTYGCVKRSSKFNPLAFKLLTPNGSLQKCSTLNMNLALISKKAINNTNFLSPNYIHKAADFDFGLRLVKSGGFVFLERHFLGVCERNKLSESLKDPNLGVVDRWKYFIHPKGGGHIKHRIVYYRNHAGIFWQLHLILSYLTALYKMIIFQLTKALYFWKYHGEN